MVIDSSAVLAIMQGEPEKRSLNEKIEADPVRLMSAASYLETAIVIDDRFGDEGARDLKLFLTEAEVEIVPVTLDKRTLLGPPTESSAGAITPLG
jgi:ribonuclease VapC